MVLFNNKELNDDLNKVLIGNVNQKLLEKLKIKSNLIRVFLSSTFTDTHAERDHLTSKIYPIIRKVISQKYQLDFIVIDLRWGIPGTPSELTLSDVCFNEIKNCQSISAGPNFVALLSERYGYRMLPPELPKRDFDLIIAEIQNSRFNASYKIDLIEGQKLKAIVQKLNLSIQNLMTFCYIRNENVIPKKFELKDIVSLLPAIDEKDKELNELIEAYVDGKSYSQNKSKLYKDIEWDIKLQVHEIMRKMVANIESLTREEKDNYFVSVTEKEIQRGILRYPEVSEKTFVIFRDIVDNDRIDLSEKKQMDLANKFFDVKKKQRDHESVELINELRKKIELKFEDIDSKENVYNFKVNWSRDSGVSYKDHKDYIEEMGELFKNTILKMIENDVDNGKNFMKKLVNAENKEFVIEILQQASFLLENSTQIIGRDGEIDKIINYIKNENKKPFIVYGESGTGKTGLLASAARKLNYKNTIVVTRFLGTTALSSSVMNTFQTIIQQLDIIFGISFFKKDAALSKSDLKENLISQLKTIKTKKPDKKIVIFLDSIDQLNSADNENLEWVIRDLPSNTKIVYSVLNESKYAMIIDKFRKNIVSNNLNYLEVQQLEFDAAVRIFNTWLANDKRTISAKQREMVLRLLNKSITSLYPLYIKLIFNLAKKWNSNYEPSEEFLNLTSIDKCIDFVFKQLEVKYGKLLFSRVGFYMTALKNGISESELEDILSLDDDLLFTIFEFKASPVQRFPSGLWARIKFDLNEYLTEKETDGTRVISWYHRRFIEVSYENYVKSLDPKLKDDLLMNIIDYFTEKWNKEPKPFVYREPQDLNFMFLGAEIRNTKEQKLVNKVDNRVIVNRRKLNEFPTIVSQLNDKNLMFKVLSEEIYFNFDFIYAKAFIQDFDFLIHSNREILKALSEPKLDKNFKNLLHEMLIAGNLYLQNFVDLRENLSEMIVEIEKRLLDYYNCGKNISAFIDSLDSKALDKSLSLIPLYNYSEILHNGGFVSLFYSDKVQVHHLIKLENLPLIFVVNNNEITMVNVNSLQTQSSIKLSELPIEPDCFLVYFNETPSSEDFRLDDMNGGIVFLNDFSDIIHMNFTDKVMQIVDIGINETIKNMFYIGESCILLNSTSKVAIVNIVTKEVLLEKVFENKIESFLVNLDIKRIYKSNNFLSEVKITIFFANYLEIYTIDRSFVDDKLSLVLQRALKIDNINLDYNKEVLMERNYWLSFQEEKLSDFHLRLVAFDKLMQVNIISIDANLKTAAVSTKKLPKDMISRYYEIKLLDFCNNLVLIQIRPFSYIIFDLEWQKFAVMDDSLESSTILLHARIIKGSTILFAYNTCFAVTKYLGFKREFKVITSPKIIIELEYPGEVLIDDLNVYFIYNKYYVKKFNLKKLYLIKDNLKCLMKKPIPPDDKLYKRGREEKEASELREKKANEPIPLDDKRIIYYEEEKTNEFFKVATFYSVNKENLQQRSIGISDIRNVEWVKIFANVLVMLHTKSRVIKTQKTEEFYSQVSVYSFEADSNNFKYLYTCNLNCKQRHTLNHNSTKKRFVIFDQNKRFKKKTEWLENIYYIDVPENIFLNEFNEVSKQFEFINCLKADSILSIINNLHKNETEESISLIAVTDLTLIFVFELARKLYYVDVFKNETTLVVNLSEYIGEDNIDYFKYHKVKQTDDLIFLSDKQTIYYFMLQNPQKDAEVLVFNVFKIKDDISIEHSQLAFNHTLCCKENPDIFSLVDLKKSCQSGSLVKVFRKDNVRAFIIAEDCYYALLKMANNQKISVLNIDSRVVSHSVSINFAYNLETDVILNNSYLTILAGDRSNSVTFLIGDIEYVRLPLDSKCLKNIRKMNSKTYDCEKIVDRIIFESPEDLSHDIKPMAVIEPLQDKVSKLSINWCMFDCWNTETGNSKYIKTKSYLETNTKCGNFVFNTEIKKIIFKWINLFILLSYCISSKVIYNYYGMLNINSCPINPWLPKLMLINLEVSLLGYITIIPFYYKVLISDDRESDNLIPACIVILIMIVSFAIETGFLGTAAAKVNFTPGNPNYCDETFYKIMLASVITEWIFLFWFLFLYLRVYVIRKMKEKPHVDTLKLE